MRLLKNQAIGAEIQSLMLSTDPEAKARAVSKIYEYSKTAATAADRSIFNSMIRIGTTPEAQRNPEQMTSIMN